jgi:hypothetical protein
MVSVNKPLLVVSLKTDQLTKIDFDFALATIHRDHHRARTYCNETGCFVVDQAAYFLRDLISYHTLLSLCADSAPKCVAEIDA